MSSGPANRPPAVEDHELVARCLQTDPSAFGELVGRYQERLVNFLYRMLRDVETAHDLTQEVFMRVYNALDRYDPSYRFSTWIFRVAQNVGIDEIRRRRIKMVSLQRGDEGEEGYSWELPADGPSPYQETRNVERGGAIQAAVDELPADYRELIELRHYAELSYEEIAELKEMPLGTVKNKLFRGRQMLKEKLAAYLGD